jgi:hypothetical protein
MGCLRRAIVAILLLNTAVPSASAYAQQQPVVKHPDEPVPEVSNSVLELAKAEEIVELLASSYTADLALEVAVRTAECTRTEPRCAPLFFAQDVILGPWNFVKLMRVIQELPDPDVTTIVRPRDYKTPSLPPAGVLPVEMVRLAEYALEQQVALYESLEAWQVTLERYGTAIGKNDESAATAQRRALDSYGAKASTAAAAVNAASLQFLESLTPLMRHFASAIAAEDAEAAKEDLRDNGFTPELQERLSALGIPKADSDMLLQEVVAISPDAPVDLLDGLTAVARGYDKLADVMTVPTDPAGNLRPLADAGPDQALPAGDAGYASVVLNGSGSTDPERGVLGYEWAGASITASGSKPTIALPIGTHHIALTVTDGKGGTDVDLVTIAVADAAAPLITGLTATPDVLAPASRQLVPVELDVKVTDNDDPMPFCQVVSVGVNESVRNATDTTTEPDVVLDGSLRILLRAVRSDPKINRVYHVTVQCTDKTNHSSVGSVFVSVPR